MVRKHVANNVGVNLCFVESRLISVVSERLNSPQVLKFYSTQTCCTVKTADLITLLDAISHVSFSIRRWSFHFMEFALNTDWLALILSCLLY